MSTSPSSRSFDSAIPGYTFPPPVLNIDELNELVRDRNFHPLLDHAFQTGYVSTSEMRHFTSLSNIILDLENSLDQYRFEQETIFNSLADNRRYNRRIRPVIRYYRTIYPIHIRRSWGHPYNQSGRSPTSPSSPRSTDSSTSFPSPRNVTILTMETPVPTSPPISLATADALLIPLPPSSPTPASSSSGKSNGSRSISLGTQMNPIIVEDI